MMKTRITSNRITELRPGEIFVFGSNLQGAHGGGAAYLAYRNGEPFGDKVSAFKGRLMASQPCMEGLRKSVRTLMNS